MSHQEPESTDPLEGLETQPSSRPEGLETRPTSSSFVGGGDRPDWLVGSDDVLGPPAGNDAAPVEKRPGIAEAQARQGLKVVAGGKPAPPKAWSGAASSVPKLTVVPARDRAPTPEEDEEGAVMSDPGGAVPLPSHDPPEKLRPAEPAFRRLEEPWYLVLFETLLTNRTVQVAALVAVAALAVFMFWPKNGASGASLGSILRHPERYEGRTVAVRGEVLESFEVGRGHAFQLRQGRDVVVVYSMLREPRIHDTINVVGIVSTGYLDGSPRVAIFEGSTP